MSWNVAGSLSIYKVRISPFSFCFNCLMKNSEKYEGALAFSVKS